MKITEKQALCVARMDAEDFLTPLVDTLLAHGLTASQVLAGAMRAIGNLKKQITGLEEEQAAREKKKENEETVSKDFARPD